MKFQCSCEEPISQIRETTCAILFWGAIALFVLLLFVLLDEAVELNKLHHEPANLGKAKPQMSVHVFASDADFSANHRQ